jgi:hypothetical protein
MSPSATARILASRKATGSPKTPLREVQLDRASRVLFADGLENRPQQQSVARKRAVDGFRDDRPRRLVEERLRDKRGLVA